MSKFGGTHHNAEVDKVIIDKDNLTFTTPCYMLPARISDIAVSAENIINSILNHKS